MNESLKTKVNLLTDAVAEIKAKGVDYILVATVKGKRILEIRSWLRIGKLIFIFFVKILIVQKQLLSQHLICGSDIKDLDI